MRFPKGQRKNMTCIIYDKKWPRSTDTDDDRILIKVCTRHRNEMLEKGFGGIMLCNKCGHYQCGKTCNCKCHNGMDSDKMAIRGWSSSKGDSAVGLIYMLMFVFCIFLGIIQSGIRWNVASIIGIWLTLGCSIHGSIHYIEDLGLEGKAQ